MNNSDTIFDCAVIGGGIGGLVAALYLKRFKRNVVLFSAGPSRASWIPKIENLLGYDDGISGKALLSRLFSQIEQCGVSVVSSEAKVYLKSGMFRVVAGNREEFFFKKVILATGVHDIHPELDNLIPLREEGLLRYCPICDGFEYENECMSILVQGDVGFKKALYISNWTKNLHVIFYKCPIPVNPELEKLKKFGAKISSCRSLSMSSLANEVGQTENARRLLIQLDEEEPFTCKAAYIELGNELTDSAYSHIKEIEKDSDGHLKTSGHQETTVPGMYAVGDCAGPLSQISVAAGQAAIASTHLHNSLLSF